MNRRKAKKRVKKKWARYGLGRWPGNLAPRDVDRVYSYCTQELAKALAAVLDAAILYGAGDGGLHAYPMGMARRPAAAGDGRAGDS